MALGPGPGSSLILDASVFHDRHDLPDRRGYFPRVVFGREVLSAGDPLQGCVEGTGKPLAVLDLLEPVRLSPDEGCGQVQLFQGVLHRERVPYVQLDPGSGGPENDFTNRNTTFMTWNLLHTARMLKDHGGLPAHGNQRSMWDARCRFDHPNPEYR